MGEPSFLQTLSTLHWSAWQLQKAWNYWKPKLLLVPCLFIGWLLFVWWRGWAMAIEEIVVGICLGFVPFFLYFVGAYVRCFWVAIKTTDFSKIPDSKWKELSILPIDIIKEEIPVKIEVKGAPLEVLYEERILPYLQVDWHPENQRKIKGWSQRFQVKNSGSSKVTGIKVQLYNLSPSTGDTPTPVVLHQKDDNPPRGIPFKKSFDLNSRQRQPIDLCCKIRGEKGFWIPHAVQRISWFYLLRKSYEIEIDVTAENAEPIRPRPRFRLTYQGKIKPVLIERILD